MPKRSLCKMSQVFAMEGRQRAISTSHHGRLGHQPTWTWQHKDEGSSWHGHPQASSSSHAGSQQARADGTSCAAAMPVFSGRGGKRSVTGLLLKQINPHTGKKEDQEKPALPCSFM